MWMFAHVKKKKLYLYDKINVVTYQIARHQDYIKVFFSLNL